MRWALALLSGVVCVALTGPAHAEGPHHYLGAAPEPRGTKVPGAKPVEIPPVPAVTSPLAVTPPVNRSASATAGLTANIGRLTAAFEGAPHGSQTRADLALQLQREYTTLEYVASARLAAGPAEPERVKLALLLAGARRRIEDYGANISLENPRYASIDESLWLRGGAFYRAGDRANARKRYYELILLHAASPFGPDSYLAFGDMFFAEATSDPSKWILAEKAYEVALRSATSDTRRAYASYMLAHALWRGGRPERAASELVSAIGLANKAAASDIMAAACRDWVIAWSLHGTPRGAFVAVSTVAGANANEMLVTLADAWVASHRGLEAAALYDELVARSPHDNRVCTWRSAATEATLYAHAGFKNETNAALEAQLAAWARYTKSVHPDSEQRDCTARTAAILVDAALGWHVEAVGSAGQPGTGDRATMALAHGWYARVLAEWDANAWATIAWPSDGRRWPSRAELSRALGDVSFVEERWTDCATTFGELRALDPAGPLAADAANGELACGVRTLVVAPAVRTPSR